MNTLGYLFIFVGLLLVNQVRKGRGAQVGEDVSDAFLAAVRGDGNALKEVLSQTGDSTDAPIATQQLPAATPGVLGQSAFAPGTNGAIGAAAKARARTAKGYQLGATGPDYYDCSGLMWRACQDARAYPTSGSGSGRFTTATIGLNTNFNRVTDPKVDDIVCWTGKHMGVVTGTDKFFSAVSPRAGFKETQISTQRGYFGMDPVYYRPKTVLSAAAGTGNGAGGGGGTSW